MRLKIISNKILKDSFIYGIGIALSKGIVFFTVPIFTRVFSPEQYGVIDLVNITAILFSVIINLGLDSAQSFYYMKYKNEKKNPNIVFSIIFKLKLLSSIIVGILLWLLIPLYSPYLKENIKDFNTYILFAVFISIFIAVNTSTIEIYRLKFKPWKYNLYSFIQSFLSIGGALLFIYYNEKNILNYFYGIITGNMISLIILITSCKQYLFNNTEENIFNKGIRYLKYGAPLIFGALSFQVIQSSDRFFILKFLDSTSLGIYSSGVNISMGIALIVVAFRKAWLPYALDLIQKGNNNKFFSNVAVYYITAGSILCIILSALSGVIVKIFVSPSFYESSEIIGIYSWAHIWFGYFLISSLGIFYSKKTYHIIWIHFTAAIINIVLNVVLIPKWGIKGAALSTIIALMISNIILMIMGNKYYSIPWKWGIFILTTIIGVLTTIILS